jgi:hypothetical protein
MILDFEQKNREKVQALVDEDPVRRKKKSIFVKRHCLCSVFLTYFAARFC